MTHHTQTKLLAPVLILHNLDLTWEAADLKSALQEVEMLENSIREEGHAVRNVPLFDGDIKRTLYDYNPSDYIILNWCESIPGIPHSESRVVKLLEIMNYTYTGSNPDVLETSWNKPKVKELLEKNNIPVPTWKVYNSTDEPNGWDCFPAIVKPALEHGSLGVTTDAVVLNQDELHKRVKYVIEAFSEPAIVEDFIDGREFHVSLWGNGAIQILPPVEMDFSPFKDVHQRLCTFDSKFTPDSTHYKKIKTRILNDLSSAERNLLDETARKAYLSAGCRDYARLDIRMRDGIFYVIDVNPNPDIGYETSMAEAAESIGMGYGKMMSNIVGLAALRHPAFSTCI